ncbi:MAG: hypothetical protein IPM56_12495 [Ignavibacteriales bacterium]|nr:MAG: hypothetical protein IPM56_12495 [Ignavibacteriales bacterium]
MKHTVLFIIFFTSILFPQQKFEQQFTSSQSIRDFADWLFCDGDYLRASFEYEKFLMNNINDTVKFKLGLSYSKINKTELALEIFRMIPSSSNLFSSSQRQMMKNYYLQSAFPEIQNELSDHPDNLTARMFLHLGILSTNKITIGENEFLNPFPEINKSELKIFYERRSEAGYKSPWLASCLSAILPGAGKFYTERWGDGITALVTTGLLTFLSIDNFKHDHNFRGWLFAGIGFFFYAGNVYGSAVSADVYNRELDERFNEDLNNYIIKENYFLQEVDLCE